MSTEVISYADLAGAAPTGLSLAWDIGKAAQAVSCPLYKIAPGFFTAEVDTQLPGFQQIGAKQIMDAACGRHPGGLPQVPPQKGVPEKGNCPGTQYRIISSIRNPQGIEYAQVNETSFGGYGNWHKSAYPYWGINVYQAPNGGAPTEATAGVRDWDNDQIVIIDVQNLNGGPDNCPYVAPGFSYPPSPPPGLVGMTPFDFGNGPTLVPYEVVGPNGPGGSNLGPGVTVNIGGATVNFGPTGVVISPSVGLPGGGSNSGAGGGLTPPQAKQLADAASGAGNSPGAKKPPSPDTHKVSPQPPKDGAKKKGLKGLAYVGLETSVHYSNVDIQSGSSPPNVLYRVGWFWYSIGDEMLSRQVIDTYSKVFVAPPGADGYTYSLLPGATAIATEYTIKEEQ